MKTDLRKIFPIDHIKALENPPNCHIGGFVFIMSHCDGLESYAYHSVNHQSAGGDTGWQSQRIYTEIEAIMAAMVLAEFLNAEFRI